MQESVGLYCAEIKIPPFTRGKKQLSQMEIDIGRKLSRVRIHVERVIGFPFFFGFFLPIPFSLWRPFQFETIHVKPLSFTRTSHKKSYFQTPPAHNNTTFQFLCHNMLHFEFLVVFQLTRCVCYRATST